MQRNASFLLGLVCGSLLVLAGCEDDPLDGQDLFDRDAAAGSGAEAGTGAGAGSDAGAAGSGGSTEDAGSDDAGSDDAG